MSPSPSPTNSQAAAAGLHLTITAPARVPLDEVLIAVATLTNTTGRSIVTSGRLNLAEGDLDVAVTGPGGSRTSAGWPWPIDSQARPVELGPGQALISGVLLLSIAGLAPLFPAPGAYVLVGEFTPRAGLVLRSDPVQVVRTEPGSAASRRQRNALDSLVVAQSLASASQFEKAADALADLEKRGSPLTSLLAGLAIGDINTIGALAADVSGKVGATAAAAAISGVLPPGVAAGDERLEAVESALTASDDDGRTTAILHAAPWPPTRS